MPERPHPARAGARHPGNPGGAWVLTAVGVVLAAGFWLWFDANFERQLQAVPGEASAAARRNPFLAAERFLIRIGIDARGATGVGLLRTPPDTADMLVVDGLPVLNATRRRALRDWLAAGGRMLVEAAHPRTPDQAARPEVFLDDIGAALRHAEDAAGSAEAVAELRVDGYPQSVRVGFHPGWYLEDVDGSAVGNAVADGKARLLQYRVGDGLLYVVSDSLWLGNDAIGEHDNALLLALLASGRDTVWLLHDVSVPGLAVLLWRAAPAAIIAAAVLAAMLVWHLGARLGPLLPAAPAGRRDLLEHLQAAGNFVWRLGRGGLLVQQTRCRVERRWLGRHPPLRELDHTGRARRIAELSGLEPAAVRSALYGPVGDAARLVSITATLQRLASPHPAPAQTRHRTERQTKAGS
ncbi:MAG: hypothetical protein LJE69_13575 [Thiohalocapsa sp.]|uniref:DUF4350 domain-containing protein n=1 Tax=Thiohalocapsa sp. TaxID=2497641 RepID=UPI0025F5EC26|nr:DUF4350 domain-containing protein [Thiohalocapsa sp.]MCG6942267.1 hypothetical protein [Thiohalocapsa sp.]